MAASLFHGDSIGPLSELLGLSTDPGIVLGWFVGATLAVGCFWAAAKFKYLYLGGLLSSSLVILIWLCYASTIFGSLTALSVLKLYLGLLLFVGYIVVVSRKIVEQASNGDHEASHGDHDSVKNAIALFPPFAAISIFLGMFINMVKKFEELEEEEKNKKRS